jgi:dienelactone hydrolase
MLKHMQTLMAALVLCMGLPPLAARAAAPVEHFFGATELQDAKISPNGKFVALRGSHSGKRDGLWVLSLEDRTRQPVAQFDNVDVDYFEWVNDQRLVFDTTDSKLAPGDRSKAHGIFAVNRDGQEFRTLADRNCQAPSSTGTIIHSKVLPCNTFLMGAPGAQDSDTIYVLRAHYDKTRREFTYMDLLRLNTVTGDSDYTPHAGNPEQWLLDERGTPRVIVSDDGKLESVHYRDPASNQWRSLASFEAYGDAPGAMNPIGVDGDKLYVIARAGQDKASLHTFNVKTGKLSAEPVVSLADFDFTGRLIYAEGRLAGIEVLSDARNTVWLDDSMKKVQQEVDARLKDTVNLVQPPARSGSPWMLVKSYSDQRPAAYLLYNTATKELSMLGMTRPHIKPETMGQQDLVRIKARDGLTIPAWLTLPKGQSKDLPLVVLVHGGPFVRGNEWGWNAEAQFLVSRGYAVLEPEFRGSTGFGAQHFRAGWKQWGLAMQDDITDATRWAVAQGIADGKRVCIAGASYGGYATLMGLAKEPDLYRCGVQWLGVTDLTLKYEEGWKIGSDAPDDWRNFGLPVLVGDIGRDAEQLKATSPITVAAKIRQPLLMAYGDADHRVPLVHGKRFHDAIKPHNPRVEMVVYDGEGHGWSLEKNRLDFWGRVERFLDRHIGQGAATK